MTVGEAWTLREHRGLATLGPRHLLTPLWSTHALTGGDVPLTWPRATPGKTCPDSSLGSGAQSRTA